MSDLISRADAIEAVAEEWLSEASAESPYVNDDDIDRYRELAEELFADIPSAEAVQRWIPCSERLPNYDGDRYLVTGYSQEKGGVVGISFCYLNKYGFWSDVPKGFQIIAWMPLPTPYKGGDAE